MISCFVCWWVLSAPCIPSDPLFSYYTKKEFVYSSINQLWISIAKLISSSSSLYLYGTGSYFSNNYVLLRKENMYESIFWAEFFDVNDYTFYAFDVAPNEGYIYFLSSEPRTYIHIIQASDGAYNFIISLISNMIKNRWKIV